MTKELVSVKKLEFETLQRQAMALFRSRFFGDVKSEAQAIAKVMAGSEIGLPPVASLAGIHIVQGKPVIGANAIASLIDSHPEYGYRIRNKHEKAAEECIIEFFKNNESLGITSFTIIEAKHAGLTGKDNWNNYPSDMLFARAISRGARRFAPGIFAGAPVYTPDELGVEEEINNDEIIIENEEK